MTSPRILGLNVFADQWSRREMKRIFRENEIRCPYTKRRLISIVVEMRTGGMDEFNAVLHVEQVIDCILTWQHGARP